MKHKLISVALIAVLLCTVLGNSIACTPTTQYDLTITSTAGGDVTTPVEGTHTYDAGTVVNLTATPDGGYRFVNWTGNVGTIADDEDATTIITMNGDYTITANFGLDMVFIDDVPDTSQPPTQNLPTTANPTNYCAPMAMINIVYYWDVVKGNPKALNLNAGLPAKNATEYLGYFMDTNNQGSPDRPNGAHLGTLDADIGPGTVDFVRWDAGHPPVPPPITAPPFGLPDAKSGYDWTVTLDNAVGFDFYKTEIDAGRPLVVCFSYWNPVSGLNFTDPQSGETIGVFDWGGNLYHVWDPEEEWYGDIGHAVTGVGYILNWDPDGSGPLPLATYVIVHDNWAKTQENIAVPWANWNSSHAVNPG